MAPGTQRAGNKGSKGSSALVAVPVLGTRRPQPPCTPLPDLSPAAASAGAAEDGPRRAAAQPEGAYPARHCPPQQPPGQAAAAAPGSGAAPHVAMLQRLSTALAARAYDDTILALAYLQARWPSRPPGWTISA